jgi:hypothetical protein
MRKTPRKQPKEAMQIACPGRKKMKQKEGARRA